MMSQVARTETRRSPREERCGSEAGGARGDSLRDVLPRDGSLRDDSPRDDSPRELDYLYNEIDKLYHEYARGCGLSDCAYWMLYDIQMASGPLPLQKITSAWSYSKQTINSALKSLQERGLVVLDYVEGSRKSKAASLTDAGRAFADRYIVPAFEAEERAFATLGQAERSELIRLVRCYADALEAQLSAMRAESWNPSDPTV